MKNVVAIIFCVVAAVSAFPHDAVISKLSVSPRYQYVKGPDGIPHLVDHWLKASDVAAIARYDPERQNVYHLYTRQNPTVSQPLLVGNSNLLAGSNFDPAKRTVVLVHGWGSSVVGELTLPMVPAYLSAEDVNMVVVDWSVGASATISYFAAIRNSIASGIAVAQFITWLNESTGAKLSDYHLIGFSLGGQQVGVTGRDVGGGIAYITSLDPAGPLFDIIPEKFVPTDGVYTEVIHTNAGLTGYLRPLGDVDFYPNGGINMAGCNSVTCDHSRAVFYMAESVATGGFTGQRCASYTEALAGTCNLEGTLKMGGTTPKTGQSGVFYVATNAAPPFSRG